MTLRACRLARVNSLTIGNIMTTTNETTHVHITRPAFTVEDAISGTLLAADVAHLIQSRTPTGIYKGVRVGTDGRAYVVGKSGRVIGLKRGEKIDGETAAAIAQAVKTGAYVDLSYSLCYKAGQILTTAQRVADYWQETGKAYESSDIPTMVGAVRSAVISGKAGAAKPDQIFEILADVDYTPAQAVDALAKAVEDSRKKATSKKATSKKTEASLTVKAVEAMTALVKAVEAGEIPQHDELEALKGTFAHLMATLAAQEKQAA